MESKSYWNKIYFFLFFLKKYIQITPHVTTDPALQKIHLMYYQSYLECLKMGKKRFLECERIFKTKFVKKNKKQSEKKKVEQGSSDRKPHVFTK